MERCCVKISKLNPAIVAARESVQNSTAWNFFIWETTVLLKKQCCTKRVAVDFYHLGALGRGGRSICWPQRVLGSFFLALGCSETQYW